jgi:hypothetical protein
MNAHIPSDFQALMSYCAADHHPDRAMLQSVLATLQMVVNQNIKIDERIVDILNRVSSLEAREQSVASQHSRFSKRNASAAGVTGALWYCPVCRSGPFHHAESFKGHIRKLLPENISSRPKCRWKPQDQEHQILVHRFEGATFDDRCIAFSTAYYMFLRASISSSFTCADSFSMSAAWLDAAKAHDGRPFPELTSSSSGSQRKVRLGSDARSDS